MEVNPDAIIASLSVGERQRVEILKALYREAKILVLDEPTAVLTPQESTALFETLKRFVAKGLSIIFISHKLGEILAACSRVSVLRGGKLVAERGVEGATRAELAELMIGRSIPQAKADAFKSRRSGFETGRRHCPAHVAITQRHHILTSVPEKFLALRACPAMAKACWPMW